MNMPGAGASTLIHSKLTEKVIGAYYDVYYEFGHRFWNLHTRRQMAVGLSDAGLRVEKEVPVPVHFRGRIVGEYRADLLVEGLLILELKITKALDSVHEAQLLHYRRATTYEGGLLLNFGEKPQFRRLVLRNENKIRANPRKSAVPEVSEGGR